MRLVLRMLGVWLLAMGATARAHRVDEYLQAALIEVTPGRVLVDLDLTAGIAVAPAIVAGIDLDRDGVISIAEQQSYAQRVIRDLALRLGQAELSLRLVAVEFPRPEDISEGQGVIHLRLAADLPRTASWQILRWENVHERQRSVYQVNALLPKDPVVRLGAERRNYPQSAYELNFVAGN